MSYSIISHIFPLIGLLLGGVQITASAFLLRERGWGPRLMLVGAAVSVLGQLPRWILTLMALDAFRGSPYSAYFALSSFSILGLTLFSIGLLLYALGRRGQENRIAELEAILASLQRP